MPFIFLSSCDDSISPNGNFSEVYALNCIINSDTTFQTAYISRSYQSDGFNPYDNTTDPALEGAIVTLRVNNGTIYTFREGTTERSDTSRYKTPLKYYFIDNYKPAGLDNVEISAALKNGKILTSTLVVPRYSSFILLMFNIAPYNPLNVVSSNLTLSWLFNDTFTARDHSFYYKLQLVYSKAENPNVKIKIVIPSYYSLNYDMLLPIYPKSTKDLTAKYSSDSIIRTLNSISEGDQHKENYIIHECEFTNQLIEKNLNDYITAVQSFNDEFSIRIDPTENSNIRNGYGLFGAFAAKKAKIKIDKHYISSLGYRTSY